MMTTYATNVVAPLTMIQQFMPLLQKSTGKTVLNISSMLGSIELTRKYNITGYLGYRTSKAALNMCMHIHKK